MDLVLGSVLVLQFVSCSLVLQDSSAVLVTRPTYFRHLDPNDTSRYDHIQSAAQVPDLSHALGTMYYHRSKMNEYLCHNYLAGEILTDLTDLTPLQSRSDAPVQDGGQKNNNGHVIRTMEQGSLLKDQGSEAYKDWLEKSAQLQDLWSGGKQGPAPHGFETGDVTGFATMAGGAGGDPWQGGGNSGVWQDFSGNAASDWAWEGEGEEEESAFGKGLAFKDLFDLAISALAFLAFGLFVLNIIIACFSQKATMKVMMATTTEASTRKRRDVESERLNELARRVLTSVDKLQELQELSHTKTGCLAYSLCDNNKFSRALPDNNRIWLPVWSLGMSWLAGRQLVDHLRASVLGFGDADCRALYPRCTEAGDGFP